MNFVTSGDSVGVGGGNNNSFEEDDEEEPQIIGSTPTGQLFPSPPSPSLSSHHPQHQHQHQHQPQARYGWMQAGEPSSRLPDNNSNNNNNNDEQQSGSGMMMVVEREHMFDKVVTPSDVGKLNRLVIPKQHAERYFPLDSSSNEKGLLLNFEDRNGKPWRFRYSYWNSSQSYVMTKGWSRFVKDKKLDAGDIVSFHRGVGGSAKDRLFIDWRHRPDAPTPYHFSSNLSFPQPYNQFSVNRNNINMHPWSPLFLQSQPAASRSHSNLMMQSSSYRYGSSVGGPYHTGSVVNMNMNMNTNTNQGGTPGSVIYFRPSGGGSIVPQQRNVIGIGMGMGMGMDPVAPPAPALPPSSVVFDSVPVVHGKAAAAKRLRLFGVNMDCPISDDDDQEYDDGPASDQMSPTMVSSNYHHQPTSSSTIPYLQLRPYEEETEFNQTTMMSSSSTNAFNKSTRSSSSGMNLDLDI